MSQSIVRQTTICSSIRRIIEDEQFSQWFVAEEACCSIQLLRINFEKKKKIPKTNNNLKLNFLIFAIEKRMIGRQNIEVLYEIGQKN